MINEPKLYGYILDRSDSYNDVYMQDFLDYCEGCSEDHEFKIHFDIEGLARDIAYDLDIMIDEEKIEEITANLEQCENIRTAHFASDVQSYMEIITSEVEDGYLSEWVSWDELNTSDINLDGYDMTLSDIDVATADVEICSVQEAGLDTVEAIEL